MTVEVDEFAQRLVRAQGCPPPYPTVTMVQILVLKRLYNLWSASERLDGKSYKCFYGLASATNAPDRTTVWIFENRIGEAGARALFHGVSAQLLKMGASRAVPGTSHPSKGPNVSVSRWLVLRDADVGSDGAHQDASSIGVKMLRALQEALGLLALSGVGLDEVRRTWKRIRKFMSFMISGEVAWGQRKRVAS